MRSSLPFLPLLPALLAGAACSDPPDPPPSPAPDGLSRWSTAPHVQWRGPDDPVTRPIALVVDTPGGRLDRAVAHADVTTFLNDRFHPIFLVPGRAPGVPAGILQVVTPDGCWMVPPTRLDHAGKIILTINAALEAAELGARAPGSSTAAHPRPDPPPFPDFAADHPLRRACTAP